MKDRYRKKGRTEMERKEGQILKKGRTDIEREEGQMCIENQAR